MGRTVGNEWIVWIDMIAPQNGGDREEVTATAGNPAAEAALAQSIKRLGRELAESQQPGLRLLRPSCLVAKLRDDVATHHARNRIGV